MWWSSPCIGPGTILLMLMLLQENLSDFLGRVGAQWIYCSGWYLGKFLRGSGESMYVYVCPCVQACVCCWVHMAVRGQSQAPALTIKLIWNWVSLLLAAEYSHPIWASESSHVWFCFPFHHKCTVMTDTCCWIQLDLAPEDLSSSPHTCKARLLPTEPSP